MSNRIKKDVDNWTIQSLMSSINSKLAIIVVIILVGIASNAYRSFVDDTNRRQAKQIEYMGKRIKDLRDQLDSCNTGTPMPTIKGN